MDRYNDEYTLSSLVIKAFIGAIIGYGFLWIALAIASVFGKVA